MHRVERAEKKTDFQNEFFVFEIKIMEKEVRNYFDTDFALAKSVMSPAGGGVGGGGTRAISH